MFPGIPKNHAGVAESKPQWQFRQLGLEILAMQVLLCLGFLLKSNMGINEAGKLAIAKQSVNPTWVPNDWYLNQPIGYQALFAMIFGRLVEILGFLATSIVGRFFCYALIASALVYLGRKLGLQFPLLLLAVLLFLLRQSTVAGEWIVGGLETKVLSYGFILWAIHQMLQGSYRWMAVLLGIATSFHVLVGGMATLTALDWILLHWKHHRPDWREIVSSMFLYLIGGAFAIHAVVEQFTMPTATVGPLSASYIYVFLRNPHHLNPLTWGRWWIPFGIYLLILGFSFSLVRRKHTIDHRLEPYASQKGLFEFTLISLIPFVFGVVAAPLDHQGRFLQYYPFRLADVLLPLSTCLLAACAIQQFVSQKAQRSFLLVCLVLVSAAYLRQAKTFVGGLKALRQFPGVQQEVNPDWNDICRWLKANTPRDATIVSTPWYPNSVSWFAERSTIASFKLVPNTSEAILEWYQRLQDLSGDQEPLAQGGFEAGERLAKGYGNLTTPQASALMAKYRARYFLTLSDHHLELPIVYRNQTYMVYRAT